MSDEPKSPVTIEPVEEVEETIVVQVPAPDTRPDTIMTTERKTPIRRGVPLKETHHMTTEAERFKET